MPNALAIRSLKPQPRAIPGISYQTNNAPRQHNAMRPVRRAVLAIRPAPMSLNYRRLWKTNAEIEDSPCPELSNHYYLDC